jgi:muramoyltetrapeptide carboxypeptidase
LLPLLNFDIIRKHPKILTGFSDTTALQLGVLKKSGLVTFSGFTFRDTDVPEINPLIDMSLTSCFTGAAMKIDEGIPVKAGVAQGPLIGGNLECVIALMGTPYQPDFKDSIILLEDVFAEPFHTDCRLSQLYLAGIFDQVAGVIFGTFEQCIAKHNPDRDGTIEDVINEWSSRMKVPCIKNFPYGHIERRCVLPIGRSIILDAYNGSVTLPQPR